MTEDAFGIVGRRVAGYYVERVVAGGGFATIYRARDALGSGLALKLLHIPPRDPEQRTELMRLFRVEAELLFRLAASVDGLVRPLGADVLTTPEVPFAPYLALEWLEGVSLAALIGQRSAASESPIPLRKLVRLLTPVARTLERAHRFAVAGSVVSMVHGDLKPENLFIAQLGSEELVKISGFGSDKLKRAATQLGGGTSEDEQPPLSPAYAAPEQWAPHRYGQPGPWTDVWGLALTLLEAMAGRPVIAGDPTLLRRKTLDPQRRPTPRAEGVEVSAAVEAVFERALALAPEARQPDIGVFWDELLHALQTPSRPPSRVARPSAALQRVLAMDLEFDPTSGSIPHVVPDLELSPISVRARPSMAQPIEAAIQPAAPSVLDLEEVSGHDAALDLDLDLPAGDPISRRVASAAAVPAHRDVARSSSAPPGRASSSLNAVREFAEAASVSAKVSLGRRESPSPGLEASPRASSARSEARSSRSEQARLTLTRPRPEQPFAQRFRVPILLFAGALLVAVSDPIYAIVSGEVLEILGLRLSLIAGALLLAAVGLSIREWTAGTKAG